jgi:uncharacterized protein (TIGR03089 family)
MTNPVLDALTARARARGAEPAVTFLSAAGERTELSAITLLNAVAKSANLLREEYDVESGTPVSLTVPWHWQRAPWLVACLALGADVRFEPGADLEIGSEQTLTASHARDRLAVSLHPFGLPLTGLPTGVIDAASESRLQPDLFLPPSVDNGDWLAPVARHGGDWTAADRVLASGDCGWPVVLAPIATPASLVMLDDAADAGRAAASEGVTTHWA